jgi:hypothetical protein
MLDSDQARDSMRKATEFVVASASQFSLMHATNANGRMMLLKPFGELVLIAAILKRWGLAGELGGHLIERCWEETRHGELLVEILLTRYDLAVLTTLYGSFRELGFRSERLDKVVEHVLNSRSSKSVELPQWRKLDVAHAFEKLGLMTFPAHPSRSTWLDSLPEPWSISDDIAYAVTHTIFYISDFARLPGRVPLHVADYVRLWLPVWLRIYALRGNWDLLGEMLMVGNCVEAPIDDLDSHYIQLLNVQLADGCFPGPAGSGTALMVGDPDYARRHFLTNYHTTLVGIMALGKLLHRHNHVDQALRSPRFDGRRSDAQLADVDECLVSSIAVRERSRAADR